MSTKKDLYHTQSYEWFGTFWFPGEPDKIFSGRLKYTPETGARLELLQLSSPQHYGLDADFQEARKTIHGIIAGEAGIRRITLLNTNFYSQSIIFFTGMRAIKGGVSTIIFDVFFENEAISHLNLEYDKSFQDELMQNIVEKKNCIQFGEQHCKILYYEQKRESTNHFKVSKETIYEISFSGGKSIDDFFEFERIFRMVCNLMTNRSIGIDRTRIGFIDEKKINYYPILRTLYGKENPGRVYDISIFPISKKMMKEWFRIFQDTDWKPVIESIVRALRSDNRFADKTYYITLYSEIENLMYLLEFNEPDTEKFIETYSDEKWRSDISSLFSCQNLPKNIGKYIKNIRASIVHPKSAIEHAKEKDFSNDNLKLHKACFYISGLLIKAVLKHITDFDEKTLNEFMHRFIEKRTNIDLIEYK